MPKIRLAFLQYSFYGSVRASLFDAADKVDKANVDTSSPMESSNRWIWALEAWAC